MKTEDLKEQGLTDEQIKYVFAENGKEIEKYKTDVEKYKTQFESTKASLESANTEIQSYKEMDIDSIKTSAEEWKSKYEADTTELQKKLNDKDYSYATDKYFDNYKFSSEYAKKGILNEFQKKGFKLKDGKFLGADDFMKELQEKDATSFVTEGDKETLPTFSKSTSQSNVNLKTKEEAYLTDKYKGNPYFKG